MINISTFKSTEKFGFIQVFGNLIIYKTNYRQMRTKCVIHVPQRTCKSFPGALEFKETRMSTNLTTLIIFF